MVAIGRGPRDEAMHAVNAVNAVTAIVPATVSVASETDATYQRQAVITRMSCCHTEFSQARALFPLTSFREFWIRFLRAAIMDQTPQRV